MIVDTAIAIKGYTLAVYYCSDQFYRLCIISDRGMEILDNHPFFTGVCPQCRYRFEQDNLPVHFDCPDCGWIDDSV
jgi:hypothetical protein